MEIKVIKCSNCGSALNINKNSKQCKCSYCGSVNVIKSKENKKVMDVNEVLKKGGKYEGDGNEGKAIELYDRFLAVNPEEPLVLIARALTSLIDTPNDDFNMELFEEYFDKGLKAAKADMMSALDFLIYHFCKYTIPSMIVWQQYAYDKLKSISRRDASKRMTRNMLLLFQIQNRIIDLVENSNFEKLNESYIEEYKDFQSSIINFGKDLLYYSSTYSLKYGFSNKRNIKISIRMAKKRYKQFSKKYS